MHQLDTALNEYTALNFPEREPANPRLFGPIVIKLANVLVSEGRVDMGMNLIQTVHLEDKLQYAMEPQAQSKYNRMELWALNTMACACMQNRHGIFHQTGRWPPFVNRRNEEQERYKFAERACEHCPEDPRAWRFLAGEQTLNPRRVPDAAKNLEKALAMADALPASDERAEAMWRCHYTVATVYDNMKHDLPSVKKKLEMMEKEVQHLKLFIAKAASCHWHFASAHYLLCTITIKHRMGVGSMSPLELHQKYPELVAQCIEWFKQGQEAQAFQRRYFPATVQTPEERAGGKTNPHTLHTYT